MQLNHHINIDTPDSFAIYQLRSGYLQHFSDGIGERLITLNPAVFNNAAFRAAGWTADPSEIKRTYSPPIPTTVTAEYFQAPPRKTAPSLQDDDDEGTLLTGQGSNDTIGPTLQTRRRQRRERVDEDDSSDLSDESEEEEKEPPSRNIKFSKMPVRLRSGSSPVRPSKLKDEVNEDDVKVTITSPSRPPESVGIRRGSLSAINTIKQRARRDTATSSEMSSENEDSVVFRRRKIQARAARQSMLLSDIIQEEENKLGDSDLEDEDISDASDLSELDNTVGTDILLDLGVPLNAVDTLSSTPPTGPLMPAPLSISTASPRRRKDSGPPELARLPEGRPISVVHPVSLLSKALKGTSQEAENPTRKFASLSGKGETNPLWIKIMFPHTKDESKRVEVPVRRSKDNGPVTVAEFIGLCMWRYTEESTEPPLDPSDLNINKWVLYLVDFGEVEYDFPPVGRGRPITDFTTNNNKPGRLRPGQRPWDEFAIVRANEKQLLENEKATPEYSADASRSASIATTERSRSETPAMSLRQGSDAQSYSSFVPNRNPITGTAFGFNAPRKDSTAPLLDVPTVSTAASRDRTGVEKTLTIFHTDVETFQTFKVEISTTTDTYMAEVFTEACEKLRIPNKALYVLKVRGTTVVVPEDRTVEALSGQTTLDLQRRRFIGVTERDGASSPSSESPNAPLLLVATGTTPKKGKKGFGGTTSSSKPAYDVGAIGFHQLGPGGKRYHVQRRQPLSFAPSHPKVIALDGEYIHIMPAANMDLDGASSGGKTTSVHLRDVIGCKVARKHPKIFRVLVYKEKETKRYEFEAHSRGESAEIVEEIRKGVERFGAGH